MLPPPEIPQRLCQVCGKPLPSRRKKYCSSECSTAAFAARQREQYAPTGGPQGTYRENITCIECGATFAGYIKSNRCPTCRAAKQQADNAEYRKRAELGKVRAIGSTDLCERCHQPYIVCGPRQRYCKTCAPDAVRDNTRAQRREWNKTYYSDCARRSEKNAAQAIKQPREYTCSVCGKQFTASKHSVTCSPECRAKYKQKYLESYDAKRADVRKARSHEYNQVIMADPKLKEERNRKQREAYARRTAALTPEQREEKRRKRREAYALRQTSSKSKIVDS